MHQVASGDRGAERWLAAATRAGSVGGRARQWLARFAALCMLAAPPLFGQDPKTAAEPAAEAVSQNEADTDDGILESALQPGTGRGDFEFFMDATSLRRAGNGHTTVRVLVQLPVRPFLDLTRADKADVRFQLQAFEASAAMRALAAKAPAAPADSSTRGEFERADAQTEMLLGGFAGVPALARAETRGSVAVRSRRELQSTDYQLFEMSVDVAPGDYVFEVLSENLSRSKRGFLDRLRKRRMNAVARMLVRVADLGQEPMLADLAFEVGHGTHQPYATRLYGLLNDSLHVATTLYGRGSYGLEASATDRNGTTRWRDSLRVAVDGTRPVALHTSVNSLPAGQYVLRLVASGPQGTVSTSRSFDVAWSLVTWKKSRRDLDLEAEIVLTEEQYEQYRKQPLGEKERYMQEFWRDHDPTPDTAHNEMLAEFHRRVAYADLNFSESGRGALSDRGKVYVRFGPPNEVQAETMPRHLAGRGAELALEKIDNAYVASEHQPSEEKPDDPEIIGTIRENMPYEQSVREQERARVIGPGNEVVAYELWLYSGAGSPLTAEDRNVAIDSGLRILFLDLEGFGRYRLRKSSARLDIHGLSVH